MSGLASCIQTRLRDGRSGAGRVQVPRSGAPGWTARPAQTPIPPGAAPASGGCACLQIRPGLARVASSPDEPTFPRERPGPGPAPDRFRAGHRQARRRTPDVPARGRTGRRPAPRRRTGRHRPIRRPPATRPAPPWRHRHVAPRRQIVLIGGDKTCRPGGPPRSARSRDTTPGPADGTSRAREGVRRPPPSRSSTGGGSSDESREGTGGRAGSVPEGTRLCGFRSFPWGAAPCGRTTSLYVRPGGRRVGCAGSAVGGRRSAARRSAARRSAARRSAARRSAARRSALGGPRGGAGVRCDGGGCCDTRGVNHPDGGSPRGRPGGEPPQQWLTPPFVAPARPSPCPDHLPVRTISRPVQPQPVGHTLPSPATPCRARATIGRSSPGAITSAQAQLVVPGPRLVVPGPCWSCPDTTLCRRIPAASRSGAGAGLAFVKRPAAPRCAADLQSTHAEIPDQDRPPGPADPTERVGSRISTGR